MQPSGGETLCPQVVDDRGTDACAGGVPEVPFLQHWDEGTLEKFLSPAPRPHRVFSRRILPDGCRALALPMLGATSESWLKRAQTGRTPTGTRRGTGWGYTIKQVFEEGWRDKDKAERGTC